MPIFERLVVDGIGIAVFKNMDFRLIKIQKLTIKYINIKELKVKKTIILIMFLGLSAKAIEYKSSDEGDDDFLITKTIIKQNNLDIEAYDSNDIKRFETFSGKAMTVYNGIYVYSSKGFILFYTNDENIFSITDQLKLEDYIKLASTKCPIRINLNSVTKMIQKVENLCLKQNQ